MIKIYAIFIILIFYGLILVPITYGQEEKSVSEEENVPVMTTKNEAIMRASATILGFTGLGFIIGAKLSDHEDVRQQAIAITIAYGLVAIEISLHLLVILWAQKNDLLQTTFENVIYITIGLVVAILICFASVIWLDSRTQQKKHQLGRKVHSAIRCHEGFINN